MLFLNLLSKYLKGNSCCELNNLKEKMLPFLKTWAISNSLKTRPINEILCFMRENGIPSLPCDSRSLLGTPKSRNVIEMPPGKYVHFSFKKRINDILSSLSEKNMAIPQKLLLDINIDGVPLRKSSTSLFWVIMARIRNIPQSRVFVVGVYHGYKKPNCYNQLLRPMVDELKEMYTNFQFQDKNIEVQIRSFICDAPAKASC